MERDAFGRGQGRDAARMLPRARRGAGAVRRRRGVPAVRPARPGADDRGPGRPAPADDGGRRALDGVLGPGGVGGMTGAEALAADLAELRAGRLPAVALVAVRLGGKKTLAVTVAHDPVADAPQLVLRVAGWEPCDQLGG